LGKQGAFGVRMRLCSRQFTPPSPSSQEGFSIPLLRGDGECEAVGCPINYFNICSTSSFTFFTEAIFSPEICVGFFATGITTN